MNSLSAAETDWAEAWERAQESIDGVTRRRVRGEADGVEIALLDWGGDGDLVLLQHANGFCAATLAPIAKALCSGYRVVALDVRGHGDSTSVAPAEDPNPYDWKHLSADLRRAVHEILEIVECDHVELAIGHSFGGALLLDVAQMEPALFRNLLLCDPVMIESEPVGEAEPRARGKTMATGARRRRDRFGTQAEAYEHFRTRALFENFTAEALALYVGEGMASTSDGDFILKCKPEVEAAIFSSLALKDFFDNVDQVTASVTFLHALRGNFERAKYDAVAENITKARVESLDVGHLFPMEEPQRVLEIVEKLIEQRK